MAKKVKKRTTILLKVEAGRIYIYKPITDKYFCKKYSINSINYKKIGIIFPFTCVIATTVLFLFIIFLFS